LVAQLFLDVDCPKASRMSFAQQRQHTADNLRVAGPPAWDDKTLNGQAFFFHSVCKSTRIARFVTSTNSD